ncbi:MAG TPA: Ppx/GppA family phosphatase [Tetrasphaera sp.]|nr:Ppx/GppA family phosphatase [Tetrasphaera sp.]
MRLGVIDIGSNTVHMLVVDAHHGARPLPAVTHKIALRLSEHLADGRVGDAAVQTLTAFLDEARELADEHGVEEVLAFATSAIREARNGDEVLDLLGSRAGTPVHVLSGADEARMTFLAARRWSGWSAGTLLVLDIGGGSLEMAIGMDEEPDAAVSVPLGAGRVTTDLLPGDPPGPDVIGRARREIRAELASAVRPILRAREPDTVVATSKTFRSLARLAGAASSSAGPLVERTLTRSALREVISELTTLSTHERSLRGGVSPTRAAQVLGGALVAEAAMDLLRVERLTICPWALREGLILRRLDTLADFTTQRGAWVGDA